MQTVGLTVTLCHGLTSSSPGAPASSPAGRAHSEGLSVVQADGLDVVGQGGLGWQKQHCHVRPSEVTQSDVFHIQRHLEGVGSILVQTTQNHGPFRGYGRADGDRTNRIRTQSIWLQQGLDLHRFSFLKTILTLLSSKWCFSVKHVMSRITSQHHSWAFLT